MTLNLTDDKTEAMLSFVKQIARMCTFEEATEGEDGAQMDLDGLVSDHDTLEILIVQARKLVDEESA